MPQNASRHVYPPVTRKPGNEGKHNRQSLSISAHKIGLRRVCHSGTADTERIRKNPLFPQSLYIFLCVCGVSVANLLFTLVPDADGFEEAFEVGFLDDLADRRMIKARR